MKIGFNTWTADVITWLRWTVFGKTFYWHIIVSSQAVELRLLIETWNTLLIQIKFFKLMWIWSLSRSWAIWLIIGGNFMERGEFGIKVGSWTDQGFILTLIFYSYLFSRWILLSRINITVRSKMSLSFLHNLARIG